TKEKKKKTWIQERKSNDKKSKHHNHNDSAGTAHSHVPGLFRGLFNYGGKQGRHRPNHRRTVASPLLRGRTGGISIIRSMAPGWAGVRSLKRLRFVVPRHLNTQGAWHRSAFPHRMELRCEWTAHRLF